MNNNQYLLHSLPIQQIGENVLVLKKLTICNDQI